MFVRVELVLFVGILFGTCLPASHGLSVSISPSHRHAAPGRSVTFTCTADQAVSACEFQVRLKDTDLGVASPAQARSGSWQIAPEGDQGVKVKPVGAARQPHVATAAPQDGVGEGGIDTRARPSGTGASSGQHTATEAQDVAEEDAALQGQSSTDSENGRTSYFNTQSQGNAQASRNKKIGSTSSSLQGSPQLGYSPRSRSSSSSDPEATGNWSYAGPPSDRDGPPLMLSTLRPTTPEQQSEVQNDRPAPESRWVWGDNRSLVVLKAKDGVQGASTPLTRMSSPYSPHDAQTYRRRHGVKHVFAAPTPASASVPALGSRLGADEGYRWEGRVEEVGCSLTLPTVREGRHLIGCRARKEAGGWKYATASMDVNRYKPMSMTAQDPPIAAPGSNVTVTCRSATEMSSCYVNGLRGRLHRTRKECFGTVGAVSGPVWCTAVRSQTQREAVAVFVRVRTQPTRVEIALPKTRFMEGEFFTATCAVAALQGSVPNISWYLGDELLRGDSDDDIPHPKWAWPWEGREWRQSLYMTLTADDDNLQLTCEVAHPDLPAPLRRSVTVRVTQDTDDGTKGCGMTLSTRLFGATKAAAEKVPWIAAIYRRVRSGVFEHKCGGTLVSRRLVVSSAQCFWDATYSRVADPSLFRVALGRTRRDWDPSDTRVQTPGIVRVAVPKHFIGRSSHFAYDVAVLVLDSPVTLSDTVVPACVDLAGQLPELQPGDVGTVAGWGVTETGRTSPELRSMELPYVDIDDCTGAVDTDLRRFLTYDKFCAGFRDQAKSVCPGDSGGGLVFEDPASGRHYLRGIASVAFAPIGNDENCFADLYTGFTLVSEYASWIFKQAPAPAAA